MKNELRDQAIYERMHRLLCSGDAVSLRQLAGLRVKYPAIWAEVSESAGMEAVNA